MKTPTSAITIPIFSLSAGTSSDVIWTKTYEIQTSSGGVYPLTAAQIWFTVKKSYSDQEPLFQLTELNGVSIDTSLGTIDISLKRGQVSALNTRLEEFTGVYDLEFKDKNNKIIRLVRGDVTFEGDL